MCLKSGVPVPLPRPRLSAKFEAKPSFLGSGFHPPYTDEGRAAIFKSETYTPKLASALWVRGVHVLERGKLFTGSNAQRTRLRVAV